MCYIKLSGPKSIMLAIGYFFLLCGQGNAHVIVMGNINIACIFGKSPAPVIHKERYLTWPIRCICIALPVDIIASTCGTSYVLKSSVSFLVSQHSIKAGALIEDQSVICWLSWLLEMASED